MFYKEKKNKKIKKREKPEMVLAQTE